MVHTSLLANGLWSCSAIAQGIMAEGDASLFREMRKTPPSMMRVYRCKDDRWLQLNMVRNLELFSLLFMGLEATHLLTDERFQPESMWENREALGEEIQRIIVTRTSDEWLDVFASCDVPVNRVAIVEEKPTDTQVLENQMAVRPSDPGIGVPLLVNHPIKVTSVSQVEPKPPPELGEHSEEILAELGYDDVTIRAMRDRGVI